MKVTILGTGAFGLALGELLHKNSKEEIILWTAFENEYKEITETNSYNKVLEGIKLSKDLNITMDLDEAMKDADLIFIAIPCNYVRSVLKQTKDYLTNNSKVILVSKGLEEKTNCLMIDVYKSLNLKGNASYLAGPTFAKELITNTKAGLTLATKDKKTISLIKKLFINTNVEIEITKDIIGIELYGVIKNILAVFMGSINEKYKTDTSRTYYLTKAYKYAIELVETLGGKKETSVTYGAIGDILLTCNSTNSRNYIYGSLLYKDKAKAKEYVKNVTVEGNIAIKPLKEITNNAFLKTLSNYFEGEIAFEEVLSTLE